MTRCPFCRFRENWHPGRPRWLRWTPGPMKNVRCNRCGHEYVIWFGAFSLRHRIARPLVEFWNWVLVFAIVLGIAFILPKLLGG